MATMAGARATPDVSGLARRTVVFVGYDGMELSDLACVTMALRLATTTGARPQYRVAFATPDGGPAVCEGGLSVRPHLALNRVRAVDTVIVAGGRGHERAARNPELVRQLRRVADSANRVAAVDTGALLLARTGLLDGRRAALHWSHAKESQAKYPAVAIDAESIFLRDGRFATCAGASATLDLVLAFIEDDHGRDLAMRVARHAVTFMKRPASQAQVSAFTAGPHPDNAAVGAVLDHVVTYPDGDLRGAALAAEVGVSVRQLSRLFREHLGQTPGTVVRRIRLEFAERLIADTDLPFGTIARRCGFGSAESLRQAFAARYGVSPRTFRRATAPPAGTGRGPGEPAVPGQHVLTELPAVRAPR